MYKLCRGLPFKMPQWSPRTRKERLSEVEDLVKLGKVKPEVLTKLELEVSPELASSSRFKNKALLNAALELDESIGSQTLPTTVVLGFAEKSKSILVDGSLDADLERFQRDPIVKEALEKNVDLRSYADRTDDELTILQNDLIEQYLNPEILDAVASLHSKLKRADKMLSTAQGIISGFQNDLGDVSSEMRTLHSKCTLLDTKRKNRVALEAKLKGFLGRVAVPSSMKKILERNIQNGVDDEYIRTVRSLNDKISFVRSASAKEQSDTGLDFAPGTTAAARNVAPQLEELRNLAVRSISTYLLAQCNEIRKVFGDARKVQRVQRDKMQRYAYFTYFLNNHSQKITREIEDAYTNAMRKVFQQVLPTYHKNLLKFRASKVGKSMRIAVADGARRGIFTSKISLQKKATDFNVAERQKALQNMGQHGDWLDPVSLQRSKASSDMPYEIIFRSLLKRLMEMATFEFLFLEHFFNESINEDVSNDSGDSPNQTKTTPKRHRIFEQSFGPALTDLVGQIDGSISQSWDIVGLLLLVQLTHGARHTVGEQLPELDKYMRKFWGRLLDIFWARFNFLITDNLTSMHSSKTIRLGPTSLHSHVTSMRFAALVSAMWTVGGFLEEDTKVVGTGIAQLTDGILKLLNRLKLLHNSSRDRTIFLSNNYDQILTMFTENRVEFPEITRLKSLLEEQIVQFTDGLLKTHFGSLVAFSEANQLTNTRNTPTKDDATNDNTKDTKKLQILVANFSKNYKNLIKQMDSTVIQSFNNAQLANTILKRAFSQLLMHYGNFYRLLKAKYPDGSSNRPLWHRSIVGTGAIMVEIKRYSRVL